MKKKILILVLSLVLIALSGNAFSVNNKMDQEEFRGLWVATVLNLDYPNKGTNDAEVLKKEALEILDYAESIGLNAVILQVRPTSDAFYNSALFPWSKYLTGTQGEAPTGGFDPLEFWVREAHKRGLELHAWINPYRITRNGASDTRHDFNSLVPTHPARRNPAWVVAHRDGNLYFDPGIPEVRQFIIDGVIEIVENYAIDGIHFDDYFYPGTTFEDQKTFEKYGSAFNNIHDWRRENVDLLVRHTFEEIKKINSDVSFGISPFGIWANDFNHREGSQTRGLESYFSHYANTKKWVEKEWLDYIAPQLYWHIGFDIADYQVLIDWWHQATKNSNVKLYIGHAAYRIHYGDKSSPWYGTAELEKQLKLNERYSSVSGSIFFRYENLAKNQELTHLVTNYYLKKDGVPHSKKLIVSRPSRDVQTTAHQHYIGGASNPSLPLYINGEEVKNRTTQGFFGYYATLKMGKNTFVIQNGQEKITRVITKVTPDPQRPQSPKKTTLYNHRNFIAKVEKDLINSYAGPTTSGGAHFLLNQGMHGVIQGENNGFLLLSNGIWVREQDVVISKHMPFKPRLNAVNWEQDERQYIFSFDFNEIPVSTVSFDGKSIRFELSEIAQGQRLSIPSHTIFERVDTISTKEGLVYEFVLKKPEHLGGYFIESNKNQLKLTIKSQFVVQSQAYPLKGARILLDPGHGGKDSGAIGLLGDLYPEKSIALDIGLKLKEALESKGATVYMTRMTDIDMSLHERLLYSREINPDMYFSIHADSASDILDLSKVQGISVFYKEPLASGLAKTIHGETLSHFNRIDRSVKTSNFYVVRGTWAPHVLIETGFVSNPREFQWMIHPKMQQNIANRWANAIEKYFVELSQDQMIKKDYKLIYPPKTILGNY